MMTGKNPKIVKEVPGRFTGDVVYITDDGRTWVKWDGVIKTGEEVRRLDK